MAKKKGQKRTPSSRRAGSGTKAARRSGGGARKASGRRRSTGRRAAGARTPRGKAARKRTRKTAATRTRKPATNRTSNRRTAASRAKTSSRTARKAAPRRPGGSGLERTLDQTPETGRSVRGRTNPMPTKRSTGTPSGAGGLRHAPGLSRQRRQLRDVEETLPGVPSSLDLDRSPSAARSGRREMREQRLEHTETSPVLTGGDVDADWQDAYAVGDEAPGGDNPTPDQDRVDDIGKALGVQYQDNEELRSSDKIAERDRHRWELDPASSEDYTDRD